MKGLSVFVGLLAVFITLPLSIFNSYLLYKHIHATDLMWFLFYFNLPIVIIINVITTITTKFLVEKK